MTDTYPPGAGPVGRVLTENEILEILGTHQFGVLATNKRDGHPHLTTLAYVWDVKARTARISTTAGRAKPRQLRRDPKTALHVSGGDAFSFAVAEGEATLSTVSTTPGDETGLELLAMNSQFDQPETRDAFLKQMVADERQVIRLHVSRLYGFALF
jgi:PPOX class probable F420-dependent enzyme